MKVISFAVNNFRGISGGLDNNRIIFSDSSTIFIFGQNNVGKSTFLNAYEFLYSNASPTEDDLYEKNIELKIELELEVGIDEIDLHYIQTYQSKKFESFQTYLSSQNTIKILRKFSATKEKGKIRMGSAQDSTWSGGAWVDIAFASVGLTEAFQPLLPQPIKIKAMPTEDEVRGVVNTILASKAEIMLSATENNELKEAKDKINELQKKMYNPTSITAYEEQVNEHFKKMFPDTSIELDDSDKVKWTIDKFGKKFDVHFQKNNEDGTPNENIPTSFDSIGHGAIRSAIFSLLLMRDVAEGRTRTENRKEYLVLFEEPELFLHPKLMRELRDLIYTVSGSTYPYQLLCASHSPQMIDISRPDSSLVRMTKGQEGSKLYQIDQAVLKSAASISDKDALKQKMYEVLRFNPHLCESFYADEVILVEGPTEEILLRGILQKEPSSKDIFIVNCGSVTNIPFYQKIFSKFHIHYHVICDTDAISVEGKDQYDVPIFGSGIQGSIYNQFYADCSSAPRGAGILFVHVPTLEPAHEAATIPASLRFSTAHPIDADGKPFNANKYWLDILEPHYSDDDISEVPIIKAAKDILSFNWVTPADNSSSLPAVAAASTISSPPAPSSL